MTDLNELLERVKAETGPDRDLDLAFTNSFDLPDAGLSYRWGGQFFDPNSKVMAVLEGTGEYADDPQFQQYIGDRFPDESLIRVSAYTGSIDAALSLVGRVYAKPYDLIIEQYGGVYTAVIRDRFSKEVWAKEAATWPLAILAAILSALIAKESSNDQ